MAPGGAEASGIGPGLQDRSARASPPPKPSSKQLPGPSCPGTIARHLVSKPAQRPPESSSPLELASQATVELLMLALSGLAGILMLGALMFIGVVPEHASWAAIVSGPVLIGSAAATYFWIEHRFLSKQDPPRPLVWRGERKDVATCLAVALMGVLVALAGSIALGFAQELLFSTEIEEQEAILDLVERGDPFELGILALSAVVLAPLTEEFLFRHMFFRRLLHKAGPTAAWIFPALAFALAHWNPVGLVVYVWLGLVFAFAYLFTGRLWVAMLVHAGHNAIALAMLVWLPENLVP